MHLRLWNLILLPFLLHLSAEVPVKKFYLFGPITLDQKLSKIDDAIRAFPLSRTFTFFGSDYTVLYLHSNGVISFEESFQISYIPTPFPIGNNTSLVAPFWADVDLKRTGTIWFRETNNSAVLHKTKRLIHKATGQLSYKPQLVFIATWYKVGFYGSNGKQMNTFQCVLVSDGSLSFSIFIYADGGIQWTSGDKSGGKNGLGGTPATVGVNAGDGNQSISVPDSHTAAIINISMTSNIGVPGVWVFQVDGSERNSMPTFTAAATNDTVPSVVIQLEKLNNSFLSLTSETYEDAISSLAEVMQQTKSEDHEQNSEVLAITADYLTKLASFLAVSSNIVINSTAVEDVTLVVSSLLQLDPSDISVESSSRVMQSFEAIVSLFAQQLTLNKPTSFQLPSLIVSAELKSVLNLAANGIHFPTGASSAPATLLPQQAAAISLPASLFQLIDNSSNITMFFALYTIPVLLPVRDGNKINAEIPTKTEVGSCIIAAAVGQGLHFQKLKENITVIFKLVTPNMWIQGSEVCVSWNFILQNWTTEGCTANVNRINGTVTCSCNHLTNFAVLVDICLREQDCLQLNEVVAQLLTFVSYIGMSVSIISLIVTITTLLVFKKLRQKDVSKYHIQLSLAMLFMLVVSLALVTLSIRNKTDPYGGCVTVSVLVHYFTLVAVMWMGAEALLMFQKLVIVFTRITRRFVISISIVCWTVPVVFVLIPLLVDLTNGNEAANDVIIHRSSSPQDISFCFLSHPGAFWGTLLAPIFVVLIFNFIIFVCVIVVLIQHSRNTTAQKEKRVSNKITIHMLISIAGVIFLFGLSWLFAILTFSVGGLRETFQILFTIFNSLQGFFIFLFLCVFNKDALESWKTFVSCVRYRSNLLHPSQHSFSSGSTTSNKSRQNLIKTGSIDVIHSTTIKQCSEKSNSAIDSKKIPNVDIEEEGSKETSKMDQESTEAVCENVVEGTSASEKMDSADCSTRQDRGANASTSEKEREMKKSLILKARFKRYTTKRIFKHHVEEAEIEIHSYSSSHEAKIGDE